MDNTETGTFGEKQMQCMSVYFNQKYPCNGSMLHRSYSMPTGGTTEISISPSSVATECWDDNLILEDKSAINKPTVISNSCDNSKSTIDNWDDCYNNNRKPGNGGNLKVVKFETSIQLSVFVISFHI